MARQDEALTSSPLDILSSIRDAVSAAYQKRAQEQDQLNSSALAESHLPYDAPHPASEQLAQGVAAGVVHPEVKFEELKNLLGGLDPTNMSRQEFGKVAQKLSQSRRIGRDPVDNLRDVFAELSGARAVDQYGTADPKDLINLAWKARGLSPEDAPSISTWHGYGPPTVEQASSHGLFYPGENRIELIPGHAQEMRPENPDFLNANTAVHEAQHAIENKLYPDFNPVPEVMGTGPKKNSFIFQGFNSDPKLNSLLQYIQKNPNAVSGVNKGNLFGSMFVKDSTGILNAWDKIYLDSQLAKDPYLAQLMKSSGHMKEFGAFEPENAQVGLAAESAGKGAEVHPELQSLPQVDQAIKNYRSEIRPGGQNYVPSSSNDSAFPYAAGLMGLAGFGTAAYLKNKQSQAVASPPSNDEDAQFEEAVQKLRQYLKSSPQD